MGIPDHLRDSDVQVCLDPVAARFNSEQGVPIDWAAMETFLYECDAEDALEDFIERHPLTFARTSGGFVELGEGESIRAAVDARRLLLLAIKLLELANTDDGCTLDDLVRLGVRAVASRDGEGDVALLYVMLESKVLMGYLRDSLNAEEREDVLFDQLRTYPGVTPQSLRSEGILGRGSRYQMPTAAPTLMPASIIKSRGLFLEEQREMAQGLPGHSLMPVAGFFAGRYPKTDEECPDVAAVLSMAVMRVCRGRLTYIFTTEGPMFAPEDSWSRLWLNMAQGIQNSDAVLCKCCDRPFLSPRKKGRRREYCSRACKVRIARAQRYWNLTRVSGKESLEAAREAHISAETAEALILDRPAQFGARASRK